MDAAAAPLASAPAPEAPAEMLAEAPAEICPAGPSAELIAGAIALAGVEASALKAASTAPAFDAASMPPVAGPPRSLPLLKFVGREEVPVFDEAGLAELEKLPGPVCPIAFVGDGRSGKSFLGSKIIGEDAFPQDDSDVAVTEGIDMAVCPSHPGHIVVFDCEGGNNAISKSHSIVTVIGALMCTALVFVTDGKASEAAIEALALMLQERSLIKCDGTGSLHAQTLLFVVNQVRLRYGEDALEKILAVKKDAESSSLRDLISEAYPEGRRGFYTVPTEGTKDFDARMDILQAALHEATKPLQMGKLWMTGKQVVGMLRKIEAELRTRGKVSLPSLHRHVILDSWLKPKINEVLASGFQNVIEKSAKDEWKKQKTGPCKGDCQECKKEGVTGWQDPDIDDFFCVDCWQTFSPKVLKCAFCSGFHPWPRGRTEVVTKQWHCIDCLLQLGIDID